MGSCCGQPSELFSEKQSDQQSGRQDGRHPRKQHSESQSGQHSHSHFALAPALSFAMLVAGALMSYFGSGFFSENIYVELVWYILAFLPVGLPVVKESVSGALSGDFFNEFTLMSIACIGAFFIGEFPEAVGVMLFYSIGETLQHRAVERATGNISRLLDVRSEQAHLVRDGEIIPVAPKSVHPGELIEVRPGERVPLDGIMESPAGLFDTSALTGESVPRSIEKGGEVLAGMISSDSTIRMRVEKEYGQSALSRILELVNNAADRKAHAEMFIRKFARVYTPVVIVLAALTVAVPWVVSLFSVSFGYVFSEWIYRALVFLVISCPCALVISVPLGYFAGIGAASRAGILFKGGNYLEAITEVNTVAFDKTGTLTTGQFGVVKIVAEPKVAEFGVAKFGSAKSVSAESGAEEPDAEKYDAAKSGMTESGAGESESALLSLIASAESDSSHPLARAVVSHARSKGIEIPRAESIREIAGHGTKAVVKGDDIVVGNLRLLRNENIAYPASLDSEVGTVIACGIKGMFAGYIVLADTVKPDSADAVSALRDLGVENVVMLSGDKKEIVASYAERLGIMEAHGELLPQDKASYVERVSGTPGNKVAFVGDGMNDAPVLALSDVGIAMGGLGSDAAIESADVVVQTDSPAKVATAIRIGRRTHAIVTENIIGAIGIKVIVLALGAAGYASLWGAVFADVGVSLLAVLNSMRIMWKRYR